MSEPDKSIEDLIEERDAAIGDRPELQQLQYKIDCRLNACASPEERLYVFNLILQENLEELREAFEELKDEVDGIVLVNDFLEDNGLFEA